MDLNPTPLRSAATAPWSLTLTFKLSMYPCTYSHLLWVTTVPQRACWLVLYCTILDFVACWLLRSYWITGLLGLLGLLGYWVTEGLTEYLLS